jgi:hypothetical protein
VSFSDHNSYHSCHQNQLSSGARPYEKLHWQASNCYSWPYDITAWNTALSRTRYLSSRPLPRSKATTSTKPCRQVSPILAGLFHHHSGPDSETGELINGGRLSAAQLKIFIQMLRQSYIQRPMRARTPPPSPPPPSQSASASVPHPDPWSLDPSDELFEEAPSTDPGKLL